MTEQVVVEAVTPPVVEQAAPPPVVEAAPPVVEPEKPKEDEAKFAARFAALSRREKELRERETKLKDIEKNYSEYEAAKKEARMNPLAYLEKLGLSYDDLTRFVLDDKKPTPEMIAKMAMEEVKRMKEDAASREKAEKEARLNASIEGFKNEIEQFLTTNAVTYELTKAHPEGVELVYNVIDAHYTKHGKVLSHEEAAKAVESYLEEEAEKYLALNKFKSKYQKVSETPKAVTPPPQAEKPKTGATLTNQMASEVPTPQNRPLTVEQSKAQAAKMLRWT